MQRYGETKLKLAWRQLDQLTKSSLLLAKAFDGTIPG